MDDIANALDPLHTADTLFGNGDGYTTFDEMMTAELLGGDDEDANHPSLTPDLLDGDDEDDFDYDLLDIEITPTNGTTAGGAVGGDRIVKREHEETSAFLAPQPPYDNQDTIDYAAEKYRTRVSTDFLIRDRENERKWGIDDVTVYAYRDPDHLPSLLIVGEIHASKPFKLPFVPRIEVYDVDGDLIKSEVCHDYAGGNGWTHRAVRPQTFYNRYPFAIGLQIEDRELKKYTCKFVISQEKDYEEDIDDLLPRAKPTLSLCTVNINDLLANSNPTDYVYVAHLPENGKIPKQLITYYVEGRSGISEIKTTFIKAHESSSDYWANLLDYITTLSGSLKEDRMIYYLFYNDKKELICFHIERVDGGKKYKDKLYQFLINVPPAEKVCRVIVYVGPHPSEYAGFSLTDLLK